MLTKYGYVVVPYLSYHTAEEEVRRCSIPPTLNTQRHTRDVHWAAVVRLFLAQRGRVLLYSLGRPLVVDSRVGCYILRIQQR